MDKPMSRDKPLTTEDIHTEVRRLMLGYSTGEYFRGLIKDGATDEQIEAGWKSFHGLGCGGGGPKQFGYSAFHGYLELSPWRPNSVVLKGAKLIKTIRTALQIPEPGAQLLF